MLLSLVASLALVQDHRLLEDGAERVVSPWTEPGMIESPVAFTIDDRGRLYVVESDRAGNAVSDTRQLGHLNGVEEDLLLRTVDDRRALIRRWVEAGHFESDYFTRTEDRIRMVQDTDGDGLADEQHVFAGGFNDEVDGIAAGVLVHEGMVYFTNIPHLWMLEDEDGDGVSDSRESLSYGYGVRWCFYGHDLHGLVLGPDGRLYFSMGDRGYNLTTQEGERIIGPDRGAVFRCWLDGSGLELFHVGLRNPQELAFDTWGNLYTGDNNCDSGDRARIVHVLEGADSGWRQNVQSLDSRGPWNRERMWNLLVDPKDPVRPAWQIPPIAHIGAGPSGLAFYPGIGESDGFDETFLMVDFYGSGSTLHRFRTEPIGAWSTVRDTTEFYRGVTITDITWGFDGRLYATDWGGGWAPNKNGKVLTIANEGAIEADRSLIDESRSLHESGFEGLETDRLLVLLGHADQRVRLKAQYEASSRVGAGPALEALATTTSAPTVQRVHAIWAIGMLARRDGGDASGLERLLTDEDVQIRIQTVRTLGDLRHEVPDSYMSALDDEDARVRYEACLALGKIGHREAIDRLLEVLDAEGDLDVAMRHGASYGLALLGDADAIADAARSRGEAARVGAVVALRRLESDRVIEFLEDDSARVVIEAARACYDQSRGLEALAARLEGPFGGALGTEPFMRRAIEANVLVGTSEACDRLARFASRSDVDPAWTLLAMRRLDGWDEPLKREGVWGNWVDLEARDAEEARRAFLAVAPRVMTHPNDEVRTAAETLRVSMIDVSLNMVLRQVGDPSLEADYRLALLEQGRARFEGAIEEICEAALEDDGDVPDVRLRALELLATVHPARAVEATVRRVRGGGLVERQAAVRLLGGMPGNERAMSELVTRFRQGTLDEGLRLEVYESSGSMLDDWKHGERRPRMFATSLLKEGGDASSGDRLFHYHEEAQCLRCHYVDGFGGSAGPDLSDVGTRLSRSDLIESIVEPNAKVNPRYGQVSTMREMQGILEPTEIRDIVAYLATLGVTPESTDDARATREPPSRKIVLLAPVALVGGLAFFLFVLVATVRVPKI